MGRCPRCDVVSHITELRALQNSTRYVEIFSSSQEEVERRALAGGILV